MSDGEYSRKYADLVAKLHAQGDEELKTMPPQGDACWTTWGWHVSGVVKELAADLDRTIRTANETILKLKAAHPLPTLEQRVRDILHGMDKYEREPGGWWTNSTELDFGIRKLSEVLTAIRTTEPYRHGDIIRSGGTRFVLEDIGPDDEQPDNS